MHRKGISRAGGLLCCLFLCAGNVGPEVTAGIQAASMGNRTSPTMVSAGTCFLTQNTGEAKIGSGQRTAGLVQRLTVNTGKDFTIVLESNPSTGYGWELVALPEDSVVKLSNKEFVRPDTDRPGAAGKEIWVFNAVGKGKTAIRLEYVRPWEKNQPPERIVTYEVTVE